MAASRCIQCCFHARFLACYVTAVLWGLCNCNSREQERRFSRAWHAVPAGGRAGGWGVPPADQGGREKEKGWGRQGGLARRGRAALYGVWGGVGTVRMQLSISQMKGGRPTRGGQAGGTGGCRTLLASRSCWQGWRGSGGAAAGVGGYNGALCGAAQGEWRYRWKTIGRQTGAERGSREGAGQARWLQLRGRHGSGWQKSG